MCVLIARTIQVQKNFLVVTHHTTTLMPIWPKFLTHLSWFYSYDMTSEAPFFKQAPYRKCNGVHLLFCTQHQTEYKLTSTP